MNLMFIALEEGSRFGSSYLNEDAPQGCGGAALA
jgi:hypothetical protein